ncbi:RluA family pseudouridine synthase [Vagococcus xieshaowenii]|uniref:Pseudouridine synthase n=1 Tax=Vagococcus xieshaowenii TaxID=2562451 RepID=A0AAJ5EEZ6_9ENTE|nr:RluA family pseudouridine synthase [Vagococcus xieshaowenii]QCA29048.1 RluA family pseudouridine synthase [Vagococcus xieshaowenii]TFZ40976.1 RluA family pseudouridine synthase [Vagococcus xieshaowenii]
MQYSITLPTNFETCDIQTLLEIKWLVPRKVRHFLRTKKNILVNGQTLLFHEMVHAGDVITLTFEESDYPNYNVLKGNGYDLEVLFEDEHLIIVDKPIKMKTHPNEAAEDDTLLNHVASYLTPQGVLPYVVHRLDMETSGLIMFAKNPFILPIIGRMLEEKNIKRSYHALIKGQLTKDYLTVNKKIGRDRHDRRKRRIDERSGKTAITHFATIDSNQQSSLLRCELETGRTHQIRVHLQSLGHPIIGDPLYNPKSRGERLMLHAFALHFTHPLTDQEIHCQSNTSGFSLKSFHNK